MARKQYALVTALVVVLAGVGGVVAAGTNAPVSQVGNTPTATPDEEPPTVSPTPETPTQTPTPETPAPETPPVTATPDTPAPETPTPDEEPPTASPTPDTPTQTPDTPTATPTPETPTPVPDTPTPDKPTPDTPTATPTPDKPTPTPTPDKPTKPERPDVRKPATISVSASGTVSAPPDTALVRAAVVATADDAETARRQVAENVTATRQALEASGIASDQIRTLRFDLEMVRKPHNDTAGVQYRAVNEFEIEVSPDRAGEIIDVAVGNGTNQVSGVTFTLADETERSLRQQALRKAVSNARTDAATIAAASGVTITGLQSASTGEVVFVPFERQAAAGQADGATTIEPGPVEVVATVSVTYRAENSSS